MLMAAADLLAANKQPSRAEIREHLSGNYCRCTGYHAIVDAVAATATKRNGKAGS
jgi:carbon-monoxide dehydrogenase small subunit